jgi:hypothetical protein
MISPWALIPWLTAQAADVLVNPGGLLERIGTAFLFVMTVVAGIEAVG